MTDNWLLYSECIKAQREELIRLTQQLIRRPSDVNEKACQLFIADWLREYGYESDLWDVDVDKTRTHQAWVDTGMDYRDRPNLVATIKGKGGGRSLSLLGHIDVVPVEEADKWVNQDPWSGALIDGKIYGRGALDMKAGVAISLILAVALKKTKISLQGDLILQSVIDEENGGNGTLAAILRGYRADASIFLEPSEEDYTGISGRGAQFFRIIIPGIGGGIEYQYDLPNAIGKALLFYQAVECYADYMNAKANHPLYAYTKTKVPCAICKIQAGTWPSTIPAFCQMEGSLECLPGEDIEQVKADFKNYMLKVASRDAWLSEHPPQIEWFGLRFEPAEIPLDAPIVNCLRKASQEVLNKDIQPVGGGGSDLRLLVLYADSPCVNYGPKGGAIHSTNEYVEIESMMHVALVVGKVILDWCGTAG